MHIQELRTQVGREEFDYVLLKSLLSHYAQARNKIQRWLKKKELIRVKKGLYVFGPSAAREAFSKEVLANLIYGPSAISLEYALSFYGFIPDRVETMTSVTTHRNKQFMTPIGKFVYSHLHPKKYSIGIDQYYLTEKHPILIASPEKALADFLYLKKEKLSSLSDLETYLFEDMRIDQQVLFGLNKGLLEEISRVYKNSTIRLLLTLLGG